MEYIGEFTGAKDKSILKFLKVTDDESEENNKANNQSHSENDHHWHNEIIASFTAGSLGAFMTNGLETVAVNK